MLVHIVNEIAAAVVPLISLSATFRKHLLTLDYYVYMAIILKSHEASSARCVK